MSLNMNRKFSRQRGALFIEVLMGIFVLGLGAAAMFSLFPALTRADKLSREEAIAAQLANRYVEHVQLLRPAELTGTNLYALGLIDDGESGSPYSFSNIPLDEASGYSPSRMLRNGAGLLTVSDMADGSKLVAVRLSWTSASGKSRSYSTGTVLGAFR